MADDNGNGEAKVTLPLEALIDRVQIEFDRRDGSMRVGSNVCNEEVILMMLYRAVNIYEFRTRAAMAAAAVQAAREQQRVQSILDRTRHERS